MCREEEAFPEPRKALIVRHLADDVLKLLNLGRSRQYRAVREHERADEHVEYDGILHEGYRTQRQVLIELTRLRIELQQEYLVHYIKDYERDGGYWIQYRQASRERHARPKCRE